MANRVIVFLAALFLAACSQDIEGELAAELARGESAFLEGDFNQARGHWERALDLWSERGDSLRPEMAEAYNGLGWVELETGTPSQAERYFDMAVRIADTLGLSPSVIYGRSQGGLAMALERQGQIEEAVAWARRGMETQIAALDRGLDDGQALAQAQQQLARLLKATSDFADNPIVQREAARLYTQVLQFQRAVLGEDSPDIVPYLRELESFLVDLRDSPETQQIKAEAEAILARAAQRRRTR